MADLADFLQPAIDELKALVRSHDSGLDDVYRICCEIAYNQVKNLCAREFRDASEAADVQELYFDVTEGSLYPKGYPIVEVDKIEYWDGDEYDELDLDDDYRIPGTNDRILFYFSDSWSEIRITYEFGYKLISENEILKSAVVQQALMIFKKKDFVAMTNRHDLTPGNISTADIRLLPTVKDMIAPLIRYGA